MITATSMTRIISTSMKDQPPNRTATCTTTGRYDTSTRIIRTFITGTGIATDVQWVANESVCRGSLRKALGTRVIICG